MDVPGIVRDRVADESRLTSVSIGNDDRVYVTPSRTLVYHSAGLFSSESVEEFPHDAARFDVSAGRREASFAFEYDDGVEGFSIPRDRIETVLPPVIAGVLRATGLIDDDESIVESYRFGERTLVVTDRRLLTSVGEAVWDRDYESYAYEDVTDVGFEAGTLLVTVGGQQRRLDLSGEGDREAFDTVEDTLLAFHDVDTVEAIDSRTTGQFYPHPSTNDDGGAANETATSNEATSQPSNHDAPDPDRTGSPATDVREAEPGTNTERSSSHATTQPTGGDTQSTDDSTRSADDAQPADTDSKSPNALSEPGDASTEPAVGIDDAAADRPPETALSDDTADAAAVVDELAELREAVDRQTELMERQQATLERLADELTDDR
ncbi:DUF7115 domain-containing protein [Halococcus agarilyticus]|uniref:DUF7115 domain-containing protein n=1 Tax=Halococcus agarilyticus TaxID=1232219 RepID=UPI000677C581|nr:hypothetical protein [Halococcus agarilyticus]